jgi:Mn2+/Fe2+ NRAMP family transporter
MDAYSRVLPSTTRLIFTDDNKTTNDTQRKTILFWMIILVSGTMILLLFFMKNMKYMVDLATTISFVTAPAIAILNYLVVTDKHVPQEAQPKPWLKIYAWIGIIFLTAFSLYFIYWRFFRN